MCLGYAKKHLALVATHKRKNAETSLKAVDHLFRARAYSTFMDSGGVRSHFDRLWSEVVADCSDKKQSAMERDGRFKSRATKA